MTLTGLQSTDLTTVAFTTEKLIIFRVILWFPIRMRTYWQIVSVTVNCSRHNLQQVYLNALSSKKYPVLRVTVCNCKKIFQCLLKKNGFYGFDEYELPLKYELPHLLYPLPQGVRKIGPPPQLPQHSHSKMIDTLPKRILGQARGLLHKCIFEDLLAIDFFFKRSTSDEAVNDNSLLLSNAIHSVYKATRLVTAFAMFLGKHLASVGI